MAERDSRRLAALRDVVLGESRICWLCGRPGANELDHVVPVSVEPSLLYELSNLRPAHARCNRRRGAKPATPLMYLVPWKW